MGVRCSKCGDYIDIKQVDEFTPHDQEKGLEITPEILNGDKAHIWKENTGNLYIHYLEADNQ